MSNKEVFESNNSSLVMPIKKTEEQVDVNRRRVINGEDVDDHFHRTGKVVKIGLNIFFVIPAKAGIQTLP